MQSEQARVIIHRVPLGRVVVNLTILRESPDVVLHVSVEDTLSQTRVWGNATTEHPIRLVIPSLEECLANVQSVATSVAETAARDLPIGSENAVCIGNDNMRVDPRSYILDEGIVPAIKLREALCSQCGLYPELFDPRFDCVYSELPNSKTRRGDEYYILPSSGWQKLGVLVRDKYEDTDWLSKKEWPVVYHGTSASTAVCSILQDGFKIKGGQRHAQHGNRFGDGIYCSPVLEKAMMYAEEPLIVDGVPHTFVFQCRVRPSTYTKSSQDVWLVQDAGDIRPCGILLRKSLLTEDREIRYSDKNPYSPHTQTKDWDWYDKKLRHARTVKEAFELGRSQAGLHKDLYKGRLTLIGTDCKEMKDAYAKSKKIAGKFAGRVNRKRKATGPVNKFADRISDLFSPMRLVSWFSSSAVERRDKSKRSKKDKKHKKNKKERKDSEHKKVKEKKDSVNKKAKKEKKHKKEKKEKKEAEETSLPELLRINACRRINAEDTSLPKTETSLPELLRIIACRRINAEDTSLPKTIVEE